MSRMNWGRVCREAQIGRYGSEPMGSEGRKGAFAGGHPVYAKRVWRVLAKGFREQVFASSEAAERAAKWLRERGARRVIIITP